MGQADTSLGGAGRQFPDTTWGLISHLRATDSERRREGLEVLCQRYWKPIYRYLRIAWTRSNEDAKDLTQAFLAWLLQGDALVRYVPERGSFRGYLKVILSRFVKDEAEARRALKRGGGVRIVPLDDAHEIAADPHGDDPELVFDRSWALSVAQQAVDRVREEFSTSGREIPFRAYEAYDLRPAQERPTYTEVAAQLGIKESDVRNHLYAVRQRITEEIRSELLKTVTGQEELEGEWNTLFGK